MVYNGSFKTWIDQFSLFERKKMKKGAKEQNKKKEKSSTSMKCILKFDHAYSKWARESTILLLANRPNIRETFLHWYKNREEALWKKRRWIEIRWCVKMTDDLSIEWMNVILGVGKFVSRFIDTFIWKKFRKWLTDCGRVKILE